MFLFFRDCVLVEATESSILKSALKVTFEQFPFLLFSQCFCPWATDSPAYSQLSAFSPSEVLVATWLLYNETVARGARVSSLSQWTSGNQSSSRGSQPSPNRVPLGVEVLAQFSQSSHGGENADQLQQRYNGLVLSCIDFVSSLDVWEHFIAVCVLYDLFGPRPRPGPHETVLGGTAGSKKALDGQERVPEKEPSEVRFAAN